MSLLKNRPLAACAILLALSLFLAYFLPLLALVILCALALFSLLVFLFLLLFRKGGYRVFALLLLSLGMLIGAGRTFIDLQFTARTWEMRYNQTTTAELVVKEVRYTSAYGCELLVEVDRLGLQWENDTAVLRCDTPLPYYTEDRISGSFTVRELSYEAYMQGAEYIYLGEDARAILVCEDPASLTLLESGTLHAKTKLSDLRAILAHRITSACEGDVGKLLSALLLGVRSELPDQIERDFRRAGVSHLLALSGLHLALWVGILDRFLALVRLGKRGRIAVILPFCVFYFFLTGCSFSMLRAVLMLLLLYLSFLLGGDHDAFTSLSLCAAAILLVSPTAVFSTSFQMTVLATMGILSFGGLSEQWKRLLPRGKGVLRVLMLLCRYLLSSLCTTLAATVAVLPVLWLTFGEISLLTPLSNLLLVPLAAPLLLGALALLCFPCKVLSVVMGAMGKGVLGLTAVLSDLPAMFSLRYEFLPFIFLPFLLLTVTLLLLELKRFRWMLLVPTAAAVVACFTCMLAFGHNAKQELSVLYRRSGDQEGLILTQHGTALICDSSNGSLSQLRADWYLAQEACATEVEVLMLTHYHEKHVNAIARFTQGVVVRSLWLPPPITEGDRAVLSSLLELAIQQELPVTLYAYHTDLTVFATGALSVGAPLYEERSTQGAMYACVRFGESSLCYHTAALSEFERHAGASHSCAPSALILGAHGPVPHEPISVPEAPAPGAVLIGKEDFLPLLETKDGTRYFKYPQKHAFVLK